LSQNNLLENIFTFAKKPLVYISATSA